MIETDLFDPGEPHEHLDDTIDIEWVDKRQAVAGLLPCRFAPAPARPGFSPSCTNREDPVVVLDYELPLVSHAFEFRAPGIWTDFVCETPIEQWTIGLEAFGIAVDPDDVIHPATFGDRTPVGLDLDVEAASAPDEHDDGFEHEVTVRGEVLLGSATYEVDAIGVRRRRWDGRWPQARARSPQVSIRRPASPCSGPVSHRRRSVVGS